MRRSLRILRGAPLVALATAVALPAGADKPFVDRSLTLEPLHFSADAAIGFGQFPTFTLGPLPTSTGMHVGWGSNLEAAVGLPLLGEVGLRLGYRFGEDGVLAGWGFGADHFARLFDPIVSDPGGDTLANPEIRLSGTMIDVKVVEIGGETRIILPTASGSDFGLTPGFPVRVHIPELIRIDSGVWLPLVFNSDTSFSVDIPAQLFIQVDKAFFGPLTGVRFNHPGGSSPNSTDVPAGIGGGYTLGGFLDLKVQVRTERINDTNWSQFIGGGLGAGLRLP